MIEPDDGDMDVAMAEAERTSIITGWNMVPIEAHFNDMIDDEVVSGTTTELALMIHFVDRYPVPGLNIVIPEHGLPMFIADLIKIQARFEAGLTVIDSKPLLSMKNKIGHDDVA